MCGIAGYITTTANNFNVTESFLSSLHNTMLHRGPDGYGIWASEKYKVALAHRRLSIIDLSDAAKQPMLDTDASVIICFNGEIYNYKSLRKELESLGHVFRSKSDTEVFLIAFKAWGIACLEKVEGMFGVLLGDLKKNEWFLVRDRMGIKPLYFSLEGGRVSFASEIKALWNFEWLHKTINTKALYHYLTFLVSPAPLTIYKGIYKLPAGYYIKINAARDVSFHEYYDPVKSAKKFSKKDLIDEQWCVDKIQTLLYESSKKRLMADVDYGAFLSGGLDSSLNVAFMSQFTDRLKTFNIAFNDGKTPSEAKWAKRVSKHFNTEHHEVAITEKDAFEFFNKMIYHNDEPIADAVSIPLYYVSKLAKDAGVTVVQVGEGADELYCGYPAYTSFLGSKRLLYENLPYRVRQSSRWLAAKLFPDTPYPFTLFDKWSNGTDRNLFWGGTLAFDEREKVPLHIKRTMGYDHVLNQIFPGIRQYYDSHVVVDYHMKKLRTYDPHADFLKSMTYLDLKQRLPELLLTRMDKMAMAASVETRVPFLDHKHVELALQIPSSFKYKNGTTKYILKKAAEKFLPHDIVHRKKVGFAAPSHDWLKNGKYFKPYFQDILLTKKNDIEQLMSFKEVENLFSKNNTPSLNYSLECWILQNVFSQDMAL